jgi:hypothetical protein
VPTQICTEEEGCRRPTLFELLGADLPVLPALGDIFLGAQALLSELFPAAEGASSANIEQIGQGKSIQGAVHALNEAGASQAQAIQALNQVVANSSRGLVQAAVQGQPGSVALAGVQFVPGGLTKVVVITAEGVATYGSATTNFVTGALVVSNFVAQ